MRLCENDTFLDEFLSKIGISKVEDVFAQNDRVCQVVGAPLTNTLQDGHNHVSPSCILGVLGEA